MYNEKKPYKIRLKKNLTFSTKLYFFLEKYYIIIYRDKSR